MIPNLHITMISNYCTAEYFQNYWAEVSSSATPKRQAYICAWDRILRSIKKHALLYQVPITGGKPYHTMPYHTIPY